MIDEENEERIIHKDAELPARWQARATHCTIAVGFEGGSVEEVDCDGRFFLVVNQRALVDLLNEEDAEGNPSEFAKEFASAEDRELHLQQKYGDLLMRWRVRQGLLSHEEPQVGRLYTVVIGNGNCSVTATKHDNDGQWTGVEVETNIGCMTMPRDGGFQFDLYTREPPTRRYWLSCEEWREALARSRWED